MWSVLGWGGAGQTFSQDIGGGACGLTDHMHGSGGVDSGLGASAVTFDYVE